MMINIHLKNGRDMKILKTLVTATFLITALMGNDAFAAKSVRGYTKKDGTYVAPSHRSDANRTQRDNWSSKPNSNPYSGKKGSKQAKK
jgi:hypothetical protein